MAALVLVGACSSDPTPKEPDPTRSTTAAPTATPPPMPDQAKEDSPEGAAAFVKHYVDVFNYAAATGDVKELSALSSPDCEPCTKYADEFKDIYDRGDRITAHLWTLDQKRVEVAHAVVTTRMKVDEGKIKSYRFRFVLAPDPRAVEDITILEQS
jgi:hypothetical protein